MKKHRFTLTATLIATVLVAFFACSKYNSGSNTSGGTDTTPPDVTVTASLQGRVLDENGLPVKDAAVTSGTATTTTDVNGIFTFKDISLSSRFGFVKVVKQGYFTASRSILTAAGSSNYVSMQLLPRAAKGSFPAATGGTVTLQTGNTVSFNGGTFVNAVTNAVYTGNVTVYAAYLDPTDAGTAGRMPGGLRGISKDNKEVLLQNSGAMTVELEGDAGEKLQIASGKTATLTTVIPSSMQANATDSIPLWYFNDSTGKWMEQGMATRQGNSYIGQVGHFTFWDFSTAQTFIFYKVRFKDQSGNPLPYAHLVAINSYNTISSLDLGYADSSGLAQGYVPKGISLVVQVMDACYNMIGGFNIGPALTDQDAGTITVNLANAVLNLSGTVVDCYNNPVTNGYVNVLLEGLNYRYPVTNGSFTANIMRCSAASTQALLTAGDYVSAQQSDAIPVQVTQRNVDAGQLSTCGTSLDQYISLKFNGNTYNITSPPNTVNYNIYNGTNYFDANSSTPNIYTQFGIANLSGTGTFPANNFLMNYNSRTIILGPATANSVQCTITQFDPVNGFIIGTLSGNVLDSVSNNTYPMTGSFKVLRTR